MTHDARPHFREATHRSADPRVLVLFAHPHPHRSRVNTPLLDAVRDLPGVTVNDLYERYPDGLVDVPAEQALVAAHETIVLQHPFYWYSVPPLLKLWLDVVLTWGWAYGKGGTAVRGKRLLEAVTTGGTEVAYQHGGFNRFTMRELLAPMDQTAHLCGMVFLPPFVVHGTHRMTEDQVREAAATYRRVIGALAEGRTPPLEQPSATTDLTWTGESP